jgi:hypothetical protein
MAPSARDELGLEIPGPKSMDEEQARAKYFKMYGGLLFGYAPALAFVLMYAARWKFPAIADIADNHLQFLADHDLGWLYAAWYIMYLARLYHNINSNGARAGARVGRPDQHVYKVYNATGGNRKKSDDATSAPQYVFLENEGNVGRFNRAQRATFHMDEGGSFVVTSMLLAGFVMPKLVYILSACYFLGRLEFANAYTDTLEGRLSKMLLYVFPQHVMIALVGITAVQAILLGKQ